MAAQQYRQDPAFALRDAPRPSHQYTTALTGSALGSVGLFSSPLSTWLVLLLSDRPQVAILTAIRQGPTWPQPLRL